MHFPIFILIITLPFTFSAPTETIPLFTPLTPPKYIPYTVAVLSGEIYHPNSTNITITGPPRRPNSPGSQTDVFTNLPFCQTTPHKPTSADIMWAVRYFYSISNVFCCQGRPGWGCTVIGVYRSAELRVCGQLNQCVRCGYAALGAEEVVRRCGKSYGGVVRAGGVFEWHSGEEISVGSS